MDIRHVFKPLDEAKFSWFHAKSMITTGMGVFTDGYDLSSIGIVLGAVLASFGITKSSPDFAIVSSLLTGAALIGSAIGAIIFGFLANLGRKTFYGVDVALMTIGALLQAFVQNPMQLVLVRLILGLGIGADYVLSPLIMAEHSNAKDRGKKLALGFGLFWGLGASTAAGLYLILQAIGIPLDLIWRIILTTGAIPAAAVIYLRRKIPETTRYLGRIKGDIDGVKKVIKEVTKTEVSIMTNVKDNVKALDYFKTNWRPILIAAILWFLYDIPAYAGILFGPSLIASKLGLDPATYQLVNEAFFIIPGGLVALLLIDRVGRKPLQIIGFIGMTLALTSFAFYIQSPNYIPLIAIIFYGLELFSSQSGPGSVSASGVLGVELAPTKIRSIAQGITVVGGRLGATFASFVFPSLYVQYGLSFAVIFVAIASGIAALLTFLFIPETKSKSLEEASREIEFVKA
ncbi:General substrate transporter [Sulfolobus islandicus Y.N.15.51]|jgi:MFS family permease|uniref:General substrate transporter n=1 Tax=Saccharolobus islandicus (strain Y.N.15.51 / Yellowstone \|nr:MFS transporter [Sulfolobus islandicus]ACP48885.1 General substrate transporter [Sulfolobus islandicus Y.N.15.51]